MFIILKISITIEGYTSPKSYGMPLRHPTHP